MRTEQQYIQNDNGRIVKFTATFVKNPDGDEVQLNVPSGEQVTESEFLAQQAEDIT